MTEALESIPEPHSTLASGGGGGGGESAQIDRQLPRVILQSPPFLEVAEAYRIMHSIVACLPFPVPLADSHDYIIIDAIAIDAKI